MFAKLLEKENELDALLPLNRKEQTPTLALRASAHDWSAAVWAIADQLGPLPISEAQIQDARRLAQNPIFICGAHRSGTTLVRDLLDGHPDLVVIPSEGTYYTNLESKLNLFPAIDRAAFLGKEWLRRLVNPINQAPYWLLGRSSDTGSPYVNFARFLMSWWKIAEDKKDGQWPHTAIILAYASCTGALSARSWVDKTPGNERFLKRMWKEHPQAKIIHVIRDPTATLVSRKKMQPGVSMRTALRELKLSFQIANEYSVRPDSRFMMLNYEELCEHPATTISKLASFLSIKNLPILHQPSVAGLASQANSSFNKEAISGTILEPDRHRQHNTLSKSEQELISAYMGTLANKLHYPVIKTALFHKYYLLLKQRLL